MLLSSLNMKTEFYIYLIAIEHTYESETSHATSSDYIQVALGPLQEDPRPHELSSIVASFASKQGSGSTARNLGRIRKPLSHVTIVFIDDPREF